MTHTLRKTIPGALLALLLSATIQAYFDVDPTANQLRIPPGGAASGSIRLKNTTEGPLKMSVSILDWEYQSPSGAKKFMPPNKRPLSCSNWISVTPRKFELQPGELKEVYYSVTVPSGTSGEYFSAVMFNGLPATNTKDDQKISVEVGFQIGSLFLVQADGTQNFQAKLTKFEVVSAEADGALEVAARIRNTGNTRIAAVGRLAIMDKGGHAVGWTKFPDMKCLPGQEWETSASWNGLPAGKYHMVATFELAPGKVLIQEKDVDIR